MSLETESMFERFGGLDLPVRTADIGASGLAALDPQRDRLLELFAAAINSELTEAWTAALANVGGPRDRLGASPVSDKLPDEPTEQALTQRVTKFPVLAIHRQGTGSYEEQTLEITRLKQPWGLHYILGPLDLIDARQLKDVCVAVAKIVAGVVRRRGHKAFEGGALQFFGDNSPDEPSPFTSVKLVSHEGPGQAVFAGNDSKLTFWAIEMRLETTEVASFDSDAEGSDFDSADITVGVGGGEGLTPSLIIAKTDQDPNG